MSYTDLTQGGTVNGTHVDAVTFLLSHLATNFAPLCGESRLTAMSVDEFPSRWKRVNRFLTVEIVGVTLPSDPRRNGSNHVLGGVHLAIAMSMPGESSSTITNITTLQGQVSQHGG